ncbi:MAG: ABC-F family ATP-binding cassette domain-containing protein [Rhodobiaceae bacterium]|nr:ABC-F family ATP-binding cassette domain-containing protein [Rhodobiaceae bacterium]
MLHINDITYRIGGRTLLEKATVALPDGAKAGLVGRNGTGKTTLFRLITGELAAEDGSISLPRNARIGLVAQEAPATRQSLVDYVLAADAERSALLKEAETASDPHRIAEIHVRLADIEAHAAESRAASILAGLGFNAAAQARPVAEYSGGWRMRVALAAILFSEPDLLLLDEPTNYLDLEGTLWLESYIAKYPHTALIISHDRDLLNGAVDTIVHLEQGRLASYRGGYDSFDRQRRERLALQMKMKKRLEDERRHMEAFVERFRAKATKARQAQSRLKALARMAPIPSIITEEASHIEFPNPERAAAPPLLLVENASLGYEPGKPVLRDVSLRIDPDDRIALLGQNGNGKSTLAKLVAGKIQVQDGRCKRHHRLQTAYFAQHQLDELNPAHSAYDHVRALLPEATEAQVRARAARLGLGTKKMDTPAKDLSGGEKARLLLGLASFSGPHLLILDEPTNHLDVEAREALAQALLAYEGAVLLISHDRHLIETCADRLWLVEGGTVKVFDDDVAAYRRLILERSGSGPGAAKSGNDGAGNGGGADSRAGKRKASAERRAATAPLRKTITAQEKEIEARRREIDKIDARLSDGNLYTRDPEEAARLAKARADALKAIEKAEELWLELSHELEEAMASGE